MEFESAKEKFIKSWGELATGWGVNKTMGLIHGLLLISEKPICKDEITHDLGLSKSNVNLNLKI